MADLNSIPIDGRTPATLPAVVSPARPMRIPGARHGDDFAREAGPDVKVDTPAGPQSLSAVFSVDPETDRVRVAVVDQEGRVVRLIPADSVHEMVTSMNAYRGRG
jgi:FlaG protein